jgi:hypothetical protein
LGEYVGDLPRRVGDGARAGVWGLWAILERAPDAERAA